MRITLKTAKITVMVCIVVLSTWDLFIGEELIFTQHINNQMTSVLTSSKYLQLGFMCALLFFIWNFRRTMSKVRYILIFLVFINWIFACRTISFQLYPSAEIHSGWFYLSTRMSPICHSAIDCEQIVYTETKISEAPFWVIRVKNKQYDHSIFVGPYLWKDTKAYLGRNWESESASEDRARNRAESEK